MRKLVKPPDGPSRDEFLREIIREHHTALRARLHSMCQYKPLTVTMVDDILMDFIFKLGDRYHSAEPKYRKWGVKFLYKCLHNYVIDVVRALNRKKKRILPVEEVKEYYEVKEESDFLPEDLIFIQHSLFSYMQKALKGSYDWRIFLQWYQDFSLDEIATELELDFYYVKNRVYRYIKPAYDRFCKTWGKDRA